MVHLTNDFDFDSKVKGNLTSRVVFIGFASVFFAGQIPSSAGSYQRKSQYLESSDVRAGF